MAATRVRTQPERDLDAEIAALARPRAHELKIDGISPIGRLYATLALHRLVPDRPAYLESFDALLPLAGL